MDLNLKNTQLFVYGHPSNSIVEAHFINNRLLYYIICKVFNKKNIMLCFDLKVCLDTVFQQGTDNERI